MGKRAADVVVGMLSDIGSATRAPEPAAVAQETDLAYPSAALMGEGPDTVPPAPALQSTPASAAADQTANVDPLAPRTLRLRPTTAGELRAAWLQAKRDDVLLTAKDFASDLLEEALRTRRRRQRAANSS